MTHKTPIAAMVIHPASDMDEATQVATIADNLDAWYVAHLLAFVSIVLVVPVADRPKVEDYLNRNVRNGGPW